MRRVPDVRDVEALQRVGRPTAHDRREPLRDRGEEDRHRPQPEPEEVGNCEEEPEEDREARTIAVVGDDEANWSIVHVAIPCSRKASFRLVFRSVAALRVPTISAHGMSNVPAGYSLVRVPGITTERGGT